MSINRIVLTGRLGKDVELRYTPSGKAVASFSLAVNDNFDREKTYWLSIIVWGKTAENCSRYLSKGSHVAVEGRISTRSYENQEGRKVYITEVVADRVEFLDKKGEGKPVESKPKDDWSDLGREVTLDDISTEEEVPF